MKVQKVACIMPPYSHYGALFYYIEKIHQSFERLGVESHLIDGALIASPYELMLEIAKIKPDITFSINGLLPDRKGNFFCDAIQTPHVAMLVDSPLRFFPLFTNERTILTCPDRLLCNFAQDHGANHAIFSPTAVASDIQLSDQKRIYDVLILTTCIDYESIIEKWKTQYKKRIVDALLEAVMITLTDKRTSYADALHQTLKIHRVDPAELEFPTIYYDVEDVVRGKERIDLINALEDCEAHIFGQPIGERGWDHYVHNRKANIHLHDPIPYTEAIAAMGQAKILINSCPSYKAGFHTRTLVCYGLGTLPITNDNILMHEEFAEGKSAVTFHPGKLEEINEKIQTYLSDSELRERVVAKGREYVLKHHTWDHRVKGILDYLNSCE